jgi:hypothetical protein
MITKWLCTQTLTSICDLEFGTKDNVRNTWPHNGKHLCQVTLKSPDECRSSAPKKEFSMTSQCDFNL